MLQPGYKFLRKYSFTPNVLLIVSIVLLASQSVHALNTKIFNTTIVSVMSMGVTIFSYLANELVLRENSKIKKSYHDKRAIFSLPISVISVAFLIFLGIYFLILAYEKNFETNECFCIIYHIITIIILLTLFVFYLLRILIFLKHKSKDN